MAFVSLSPSVAPHPHPQGARGPGQGGRHGGASLRGPEGLSPHLVPVLSRGRPPGEQLGPLRRRSVLQPVSDRKTFWKLLLRSRQWSRGPAQRGGATQPLRWVDGPWIQEHYDQWLCPSIFLGTILGFRKVGGGLGGGRLEKVVSVPGRLFFSTLTWKVHVTLR